MAEKSNALSITDFLSEQTDAECKIRVREITGKKKITNKTLQVYKEIRAGNGISDDDLKTEFEILEKQSARLPSNFRPTVGELLKKAARKAAERQNKNSPGSKVIVADFPDNKAADKGVQIHLSSAMKSDEIFQSELTNIVINTRKKMSNGLYLFPPPTGIGKSFCAGEAMTELWHQGGLIWFITGAKNNLRDPIDTLLTAGKRRFDEEEYELLDKSVIVFTSIEDSWLKFLGKSSSDKKRKAAVREIRYSEVMNAIDDSEDILKELIKRFDSFMLNQDDILKEKFAKEEIRLRSALKQYLHSLKVQVTYGLRGSEKRDAWAAALEDFLNENKWVEEVYPFVNIHRRYGKHRPIVFCSVSKTVFPADDLNSSPKNLFMQIAELGGTVFIDEIDQSKAIIRNHLLQTVMCNKFSIAITLRDNFTKDNMQEILDKAETEEEACCLIERLESAKEIIDKIEEEHGKLTMRREYSQDCAEELRKNRHFIIEPAYNSFVNEPLKYALNKNKTVIIDKFDTDTDSNSSRLEVILSKLSAYISYFFSVAPLFLSPLAAKKGLENPYDPDCMSSFLYLCGFEKNTPAYNYTLKRLKQMKAPQNTEVPFDSIYSKGISITVPAYDVAESEINTTDSLTVELSPEAILAHIAESCLVFGLSATASYETVINNYNYEWIRGTGVDVRTLSDEDRAIVDRIQASRFGHIDRVRFNCAPISGLLAPDQDIDTAIRSITNNDDEALTLKKLIGAFQIFSRDGHTAGLVFMQKYYGEKFGNPGSAENERILRDIFSSIDPDIVVMFQNSGNYNTNKTETEELLADGRRVFIIGLYQSTSTGLNPNYPLTAKNSANVVRVAADDYRHDSKVDYDFLYFAKRTNVFPTENVKEKGRRKNYSKELTLQAYLTEELYENDEISSAERVVMHKGFMSRGILPLGKQVNLLSYQGAVTISLVQGAGRGDRSTNKRDIVGFYFADDFANKMNGDYLRNIVAENPLNPHTKKLLETIADCNEKHTDFKGREERTLSRYATRAFEEINRSYGRIRNDNLWNPEKIERYKQMRMFSLRHPVCSSDAFDEAPQLRAYYLPGPEKYYKFSYRDGAGEIDISKEPRQGFKKIEIARTNADTLMLVPTIRAYFEKNGFATEWANDSEFIMSPGLMINMYMGQVGESAFEALLGDIGLEECEIPRLFELFDFYVKNVGIDVKNFTPEIYSEDNMLSPEFNTDRYLKKVEFKLNKTGCNAAVYANMIDDGSRRGIRYHAIPANTETGMPERQVLVVGGLITREGEVIKERIDEIREFVHKHNR